jgi:hypothetical protein
MRKAMWRPVADDRRAADLAAIAAAVDNAALVPPAVPTMRRRLSVVAVAAGLFVLPAGIAIAAEGSLPGDALYPVKRVTETVRSWIDDDLPAQHRVEELEKLMAASAPDDVIADQVRRATEAVDELAVDHDLRPRLAGATSGTAGDGSGPGPGNGPGPGVTSSTVPPTRTTTVTSRPSDRPAPTTTTLPDVTTTTVVDATTTTTAATTTTVRPNTETYRVIGSVHAGPTCPVERVPPDPDCADQPVAGAVLVITDEDGSEVARLVSNQAGRFQIRLPNGVYQLHPQPYDGLLGTAPMQEFVVEAGPLELDAAYDTGIR